MTEGTPIDIEKMRSIGVISKRTGSSFQEGRVHPESGLQFKATTDEQGHTVTTHSEPGSGVDIRQDVAINANTVRPASQVS